MTLKKGRRSTCVLLVAVVSLTFLGLLTGSLEESVVRCQKRLTSDLREISLTYENIEWNLDEMSFREIFEYFSWKNASSCRIKQDFGGKMLRNDSIVGYISKRAVCLDRNKMPDPRKCLVYSFGIKENWSFEKSMVLFGCDVYAFDPSTKYNNHTRWTFIHVFRMGLDNRNYEAFENQSKVPMRNLKTVYEQLKSKHGDEVIDYLNIEVNSVEWDVLPEIIASGMMDKVRQMTVEVHTHRSDPLEKLKRRAEVLRQLEKHGMVRFNSKPNIFSLATFQEAGFTNRFPQFYDIAFYNTKLVRNIDL